MVKVGGKIRNAVHAKNPELVERGTGLGCKLVPLRESDQTEEEKLVIKRMVRLRRKAIRKLNGITEEKDDSSNEASSDSDTKSGSNQPHKEKPLNGSEETEGNGPRKAKEYDEISDSELSLYRYDPSDDDLPPFREITLTTYDSFWNPATSQTIPLRTTTHPLNSHFSSQPPSPPPPALPPSIYIKNPSYPTLLEQEYLKEMFKGQSDEMRQYWERCKRYFDGKEALEKASVKEVDLERKDVRRMVAFLKLLDSELGGVGFWRGW